MSPKDEEELAQRLTRWLVEGADLYASGLVGYGMSLRRVYDPMVIRHTPAVKRRLRMARKKRRGWV